MGNCKCTIELTSPVLLFRGQTNGKACAGSNGDEEVVIIDTGARYQIIRDHLPPFVRIPGRAVIARDQHRHNSAGNNRTAH